MRETTAQRSLVLRAAVPRQLALTFAALAARSPDAGGVATYAGRPSARLMAW
jgi:hypothetical protein